MSDAVSVKASNIVCKSFKRHSPVSDTMVCHRHVTILRANLFLLQFVFGAVPPPASEHLLPDGGAGPDGGGVGPSSGDHTPTPAGERRERGARSVLWGMGWCLGGFM